MSEKIQTRIFNYGNEKESSWPAKFGTSTILGENQGGGLFHIDEATGELADGYPPPKVKKRGRAPAIIMDSIEPHYHHGACMWTDSKTGIRDMDKASGMVTLDHPLKGDKSHLKRLKDERRKDLHESMLRAVEDVKNNNTPLTEEQKAACAISDDITAKALNWDCYNVGGIKGNKKGKPFKRK